MGGIGTVGKSYHPPGWFGTACRGKYINADAGSGRLTWLPPTLSGALPWAVRLHTELHFAMFDGLPGSAHTERLDVDGLAVDGECASWWRGK